MFPAWEPRPVIAGVLAHQGGWDEMLLVALPIALFAFLLHVANKKAKAQLEAEENAESGETTDQLD